MDSSSFIKNQENTTKVKLVYLTEGTGFNTVQNKTKILNFVKNGGGLVVGITPWGWAQVKGSNDFSLMLCYNTLIEAGMLFNQEIIWGSEIFYTNQNNLYISNMGNL